MDIQDWGAVGEIAGAIATVGTLLYLALQIRANTQVAKQQALTDTINRMVLWQSKISDSPENLECWIKGLDSFFDLEIGQRIRFSSFATEIFASFEATFEAAKTGNIKNETIDATYLGIAQLFRNRGIRQYWTQSPFSEDFRNSIDEYIRTSPRLPPEAPGGLPFYLAATDGKSDSAQSN